MKFKEERIWINFAMMCIMTLSFILTFIIDSPDKITWRWIFGIAIIISNGIFLNSCRAKEQKK